ncbi:MAG: hypothetical protein WCY88_06650 [Spongiibacteraceae bacterium]
MSVYSTTSFHHGISSGPVKTLHWPAITLALCCIYLSCCTVTFADPLLLAAKNGNEDAQRAYAWQQLRDITQLDSKGMPVFTHWISELQTFSTNPENLSAPAFPGAPATTDGDRNPSGHGRHGGPLINFMHFNPAAWQHIRSHRLYDEKRLDALAQSANKRAIAIPAFPQAAKVLMTAWWPVRKEGGSPMPVWEPDGAHRHTGSNSYLNWQRVIAIKTAAEQHFDRVSFAGRVTQNPDAAELTSLFYLPVDSGLANRIMADPGFAQATHIAIGRPLQSGDYLALVGVHLMSKALPRGIWSTFWWQDEAPVDNPPRENVVSTPWNQYRMDTTFDTLIPAEKDASPNICFNPWFDATFPDSGEGNGLKANCMSCHLRASFPREEPLRITRGEPDILRDPAFGAGHVTTGMIWSIANTSRRGTTDD